MLKMQGLYIQGRGFRGLGFTGFRVRGSEEWELRI